MKKLFDVLLTVKAATFLAFYMITWIFTIWLFAILLPEKFANNPVVNQFIAMASNIISFISGFFFAGAKDSKKSKDEEQTTN